MKEVKFPILKSLIIHIARRRGCDWDGDIVVLFGRVYVVELKSNIVMSMR